MLLNAAKFQGYSFYCFWVIKGKPTGGGGGGVILPPRLGLNVDPSNLVLWKPITLRLMTLP